MGQENEAKFIRIDPKDIRRKLVSIGAELKMPMTLLKRAILETLEMRAQGAFVRVRDEGDHITAVYKQHASLSLGGAHEISIVVDDFQEAVKIFEATGLEYKSYQETKRETWIFKDATITLDIWLWLDPLVEIESETPESVRTTATTLGFNWDNAVFGGIMIVYQTNTQLNPQASIIDLAEVKFDSPVPEMFLAR